MTSSKTDRLTCAESSTRNTRIERLWVEVGSQFARRWRAFFVRLEDLHRLNPGETGHLWLLHFLFLESINHDCDEFREHWNHHPLSGNGKDRSPLVCGSSHARFMTKIPDLMATAFGSQDMRFLGKYTSGTPSNDYGDVHPSILNERYGVDRPERILRPDQSGAGHSDDENGDSDVDDDDSDSMDDDSSDWSEGSAGDRGGSDEEDSEFFGTSDSNGSDDEAESDGSSGTSTCHTGSAPDGECYDSEFQVVRHTDSVVSNQMSHL